MIISEREGAAERQGSGQRATFGRNPYHYIEERERHDVLKRFKGASLYKRERDALIKNMEVGMTYSGRDLSSQAGQQLSAIRPLLTYNFMDVPPP